MRKGPYFVKCYGFPQGSRMRIGTEAQVVRELDVGVCWVSQRLSFRTKFRRSELNATQVLPCRCGFGLGLDQPSALQSAWKHVVGIAPSGCALARRNCKPVPAAPRSKKRRENSRPFCFCSYATYFSTRRRSRRPPPWPGFSGRNEIGDGCQPNRVSNSSVVTGSGLAGYLGVTWRARFPSASSMSSHLTERTL